MLIACWNVRTLQDNKTSPERKTAIVARFLQEKSIKIAALSETRLPETGQLEEVVGGYTFYWSGKPADKKHESGVCFAIRSDMVKSLDSLPIAINDRLMTLRISIGRNKFATLISAYAPTMTNEEENKEKFYADLRSVLKRINHQDKVFLMGDFNARVGSDHLAWPNVLGRHGIGNMNSNGLLLLALCSEFGLCITNSFFQQANSRKTSWKHPRSGHYHLIDYIIVRSRDRAEVNITRSFHDAECWSDHSLIRSKISMKIVPQVKLNHKSLPRKIDTSKLKINGTPTSLSNNCDEKLQSVEISDNIETSWKSFRDALYESSSQVLGFARYKHQDWFDENDNEIKQKLAQMYKSHSEWMCDRNSFTKKKQYKATKSSVQVILRKMKQDWWQKKATALQESADKHDIKSFFQNLKGVFGPKRDGISPLESTDGNLLTDRKDILKRWAQHFENVLNRPSTIDNSVIDNIPQRPVIHELSANPSISEVKSAIKQLSNGKAPGEDGIPAEIFKCGSNLLISKLTDLINLIWSQGSVPQQFKDAIITHLYKHKGRKCECDNHRGISLLSVAGKILARVILNRMNTKLVSSVYPESQCGFRSGRGTVDMVFSLRQLQEKAREHDKELYVVFVDLTKAFDTVSRGGLWNILKKAGIPDEMLNVIISLHEGMKARVRSNGELSDEFNVSNGTKQGCVLAPVLFAIYFAFMLDIALKDLSEGIDIQFRTSGGIHNQQRFKGKSFVKEQLIRDLLFADDCALASHSIENIQTIVDSFSTAAKAFGLTISIKKTELLFQPRPNHPPEFIPKVFVDGKALKTVQTFIYLGSTITSDAKMDKEVETRIGKASSAFGSLYNRLWSSHDVSLRTKVDIYKAVVLTTLLYGAESWTLYRKHIAQLDSFHMRCLRQLCKISWHDKISNAEVLSRCNIFGIESFLIKVQLRWCGHVVRMEDDRIPKQLFYGQISNAPRRVGRPLLRYKDKVKDNLKRLDINHSRWEHIALDRKAWRTECFSRAKVFERTRIEHRDALRVNNKQLREVNPVGNENICAECGFAARSKAGLSQHIRFRHR